MESSSGRSAREPGADRLRLLERRQSLRRTAGRGEDVADPPAGGGADPAGIETGPRFRPIGPLAGLLVEGQGSRVVAGFAQQPGDDQRSPKLVEDGRGAGPRPRRQLDADGQRLAGDGQRLAPVTDVGGQPRQFLVRPCQRPPRLGVGPVGERRLELDVEVGRAPEELGAEAFELLLLQEQVLARLAVVEPDRVHRQPDPLALADDRVAQILISPGLADGVVRRAERPDRQRQQERRGEPPPAAGCAGTSARAAPALRSDAPRSAGRRGTGGGRPPAPRGSRTGAPGRARSPCG